MDNHPHHTFGSLGPKFATPVTFLNPETNICPKLTTPITLLALWVQNCERGCKFWIEKMKFATPLTFLVLWVSKFGNPLTLLALWNIFCFVLQRNVIEKQSFQSFVATPLTLLVLWVQNLAHFWLSVSKIWHPSHTFGLSFLHCSNHPPFLLPSCSYFPFTLFRSSSHPPPIILPPSSYLRGERRNT